jgi:ribosomal-protein-alanine N-acetyltransferase
LRRRRRRRSTGTPFVAIVPVSRIVLHTPRLRLRELVVADAPFVLELLTDADFLRHIGDRGVRDIETAKSYIAAGPQASYAQHGHGLWLAEIAATGEPAGMCGLLRRATLDAPDLGYAWLPRFRGIGYAGEAAAAVLAHAATVFRMPRVLAIVSRGNSASCRLLDSVGMRLEGERDFDGETLLVYAIQKLATSG